MPLLSSTVNALHLRSACLLSRHIFCRNRKRVSTRCHIGPENAVLQVSEEVRDAVNHERPVVALESTIYTHGRMPNIKSRPISFLIVQTGFPYPENTALASHLESVVRVNGGVPATIGVLNGVARVGFSAEELIELTASAGRPETRKVSRRDLAYILGLVILFF